MKAPRLLVLLLAWLPGAAPRLPAAEADALFDPAHVLEVRIQIAPADWEALRHEHHDLLVALGPGRLEKPEPKPYKTYPADVTIDGVRVPHVGLHKRGFLGSASMQRPSLGIRFSEYEEEKSFCGATRMSLNNNQQDPSQVHQAIAYRVFNAAGVAAPRCNFARVTVNGRYLGVYSHVEPVESGFLKRRFGSAAGNLYEGLISDFRPGWTLSFERKNHHDRDRSDLEAVVKALEIDDAHLLTRLNRVLDVEQYLKYWAVETLVGHWDSYSNNENNFFVYTAPPSGRFQFIPWGADSVLGDRDPFTTFKRPETLVAMSLLPRRLYQLPPARERYRQALRDALQTAWHEPELLAEVDRLEGLLRNVVQVQPNHFQNGLGRVRHFIRTRRAALEKELAGPAPEWTWPLKDQPILRKSGTLDALFQCTWQPKPDLGEFFRSVATVSLEINGRRQDFGAARLCAFPSDDPRTQGGEIIGLVGLNLGEARVRLPLLSVQPEFFKPRTVMPVDGFTAGSFMINGQLWPANIGVDGLLLGTLKLFEAGTNPGAPVSGRLHVDVYRIRP